jgi:hypothetical protein
MHNVKETFKSKTNFFYERLSKTLRHKASVITRLTVKIKFIDLSSSPVSKLSSDTALNLEKTNIKE